MRYRPETYARALFAVLREEPDGKMKDLMRTFVDLVIKNGDGSHLEKIVFELEKMLTREAGGKTVVLEFARPPAAETLEGLVREFKPTDSVRVEINPLLHAGVRLTINDEEELDNSLARKLRLMFNN